MLQARAYTFKRISKRESILLCAFPIIFTRIYSMKCNLAFNALALCRFGCKYILHIFILIPQTKIKAVQFTNEKTNERKNNKFRIISESVNNATNIRLRSQSKFEETRKMKNLPEIIMLQFQMCVHALFMVINTSELWSKFKTGMDIKTTQAYT